MSTRHRPPLDRVTAEQLLRGQPVKRPTGGPAGTEALARVLAAAAAPGRSHELSGHKHALAAFRAARLSPATRPRRRLVIRTSTVGVGIARVLTLKAAAAAAALAVAGIAFAAGTGHLPLPSYFRHATGAARTSQAATPTPSRHPHATASPSTSSASLAGLCRAYTAGVAVNPPGKVLENPAFAGLIAAAGGKGNVTAFCSGVLSTGQVHSPKAHHTPSPHGTGKPSSHPTGRRSASPSVVPTSLPTVDPTKLPNH